jgi:hypothetical protein
MTDTYCAYCHWLHSTAKGASWRSWLCARAESHLVNPVTGTIDPPFHPCWRVNTRAECQLYEAGPNCLHPEEVTQ